MKPKLRVPVRETLQPAVDEAQAQRMWSSISARRRPAARSVAPRLIAVAAAVLVAFFVTGVSILRNPVRDIGPVRRAQGGSVGNITLGSVTLTDGSIISVLPGTQLDELQNDGHAVTFLLVHGHVSFEVRPHGPRQWTVECGLATVSVVGTGFDLDRDATSLVVRVRHGVVLVRGDDVPDRVQRLTVGQVITLHTPSEPIPPSLAASSAPSPTTAPSGERARGPRPSSPPAGVPRPAEGWHALAARQAWGEAYRVLGAEGIAVQATRATVEDLMTLADVARLSGHPQDAVAPLERVLHEDGRSPEAPLAAFTLGRIQLDALGQPARAAEAFAQAIALGPPPALADDAFARLAEARQRAGDRSGARAAAADYLRLFPAGRNLEPMRALANEP